MDNIDIRFTHILTKVEMNGKYITLSDNTDFKPKYYGYVIGACPDSDYGPSYPEKPYTKFRVFIEFTEWSFPVERKYDYKGHFEINKLYGVNLDPLKNFGLKPGSRIEIYTEDDDYYFQYTGDPEDHEAYQEAFRTYWAELDEHYNKHGYPINVVFPFDVLKCILGVTDKEDDIIMEMLDQLYLDKDIEDIINISKNLIVEPDDFDIPFFDR